MTPDALAGRDALATLWEFELEVSITPSITVVAVGLEGRLVAI